MRASRVVLMLGVLAVLLAGCGDGGEVVEPDEAAADAPTDAGVGATDPGVPGVPATENIQGEVPAFMADFSRLCEAQIGFPGVAQYDGEPGVHKVQLFEQTSDGDGYIESSTDLPKAWVVKQDADFADNSELVDVELVACSERTKTKPTGTKCDYEDNDGKATTVELVDTTYELTVYHAGTAEVVGSETLKARDGECPMFAALKEGQTELLAEPSDNRLAKALRPFVDP